MQRRKAEQAALGNAAAAGPELPPAFLTTPSLVLNRQHPLSDLLHRRARYKVYWGGRGSAKSWGFAEALVRLASALPVRVLCVREFQNSIKDSSHRILKDTIERLGMQGWFTVTAESIKSRSGAEFLFKGMHDVRSGNSVRSTEGVDICWVEEAQSMTAESWRTLAPTIRKQAIPWSEHAAGDPIGRLDGYRDAEIWVSYNLMAEADATHSRFVDPETGGARRANSIVHKVNYDSNPYFGGLLREEMEEDKRLDYDLYEHIWLGMPLKKSNAIIFSGRYRIEEFDEARVAALADPKYGADFGFANDPSTLVRSFPVDADHDGKRRLYVTHAEFGWGVELDDLPAMYDRVPGSRDWPIHADSSAPATISHVARRGFSIHAAEKWPGSVEDGIRHLRGFDEIVIHPRCCSRDNARPGLGEEAYLYRYKTDPRQVDERGQPLVLPVIVDRHNHGWDAVRYSLDQYIQRSGSLGMWARLGRAA